MAGRSGPPTIPAEVQRRFWQQIRAGCFAEHAAVSVGVSPGTGKRWFRKAGGVIGHQADTASGYRLSFAEREDIAIWHGQRVGVREIGRRLGRPASTISRELRRPAASAQAGYRASTAQAEADRLAKRPKPRKLGTNLVLRREVQHRLAKNYSPEQIASRLRVEFPEDEQMRISHEAIYQAIYVQGRGALRRDLAQHLRTGRAIRKSHRNAAERRGRIPDMINISQRPAEVADRAVPGHWEGDLILGSVASGSAIGTLVERTTRFVMLLHLPGDHTALTVQQAMVEKMATLPEALCKTLTWDQGVEMTNHVAIAAATGLDIYFCDPHSPWQRGTNENTNGLLRQYFPKGSDLSQYGPGYLDYVAAELNTRPRKTLDWKTPAEALNELLSDPTNPASVALTP